MFVSAFTVQLPTLLVCLAACVIVLVRWRQLRGGAIWALAGFGLALVLCLVVPLVQTLAQHWVMQSGETSYQRAWVFTGLSVLWSLLRAGTYAFLLLAVVAGRGRSAEG